MSKTTRSILYWLLLSPLIVTFVLPLMALMWGLGLAVLNLRIRFRR